MTVAKVDFKRELRELYVPGRKPVLVHVPELAYLMIDGIGSPEDEGAGAAAFAAAVGALYAVAYTAKFAVKRSPGGADYTVPPLEGLWWTPDGTPLTEADPASWRWTLMIMQPDQAGPDVVAEAMAAAARKDPGAPIDRLRLERLEEGLCAQVMHVGPYAAEGPTIALLHRFIADSGHEPAGPHHEIYLGDPRRTAPERLRTVLRQPVR